MGDKRDTLGAETVSGMRTRALLLVPLMMIIPSAACTARTLEFLQLTTRWLDRWIIHRSLCPFAAGVRSHTKTVLAQGSDAPAVIAAEVHELAQVDADSPATTLIVLPDYEAFADLMHLQEQETLRLEAQAAEPPVQLIAFHPDAAFGEMEDDPADLSMRSPYPMLHLLRNTDVEAAEEEWIRQHAPADAPSIQEKNAAYLRGLGFEAAEALRKAALEK